MSEVEKKSGAVHSEPTSQNWASGRSKWWPDDSNLQSQPGWFSNMFAVKLFIVGSKLLDLFHISKAPKDANPQRVAGSNQWNSYIIVSSYVQICPFPGKRIILWGHDLS